MKKFEVINAVKQWWHSFEKYPTVNWIISILWLLGINWLAFLGNLGNTGLVDETEPIFAETARQMTITGDWITPYFDGETRFDKPPLIYWLMAICYKLIGVNEWAVRLPSALAAIALTIFCFYTLRYFGFATPPTVPLNRQTQRQLWLAAWIGSAISAFNLQTLIWAHQGVSDMLLSGCMGTALLCFFWGYASGSQKSEGAGLETRPYRSQKDEQLSIPTRWYLSFYVLSALAVLAKGPVGVILPGLIIFTFLLYLGKLREVLQEMKLVGGGLIFLIIALPWYILVTLRNGDKFINSFFGYHNFERFTEVVNDHTAPFYFYFLVVLIGFIPWSIYLPLAIARLNFWQRRFWTQQPRSSQLSLFAVFWFFGIFLFFTIAVTKLPSYVLPLIPAAAILVASMWSEKFINDELLVLQNKPLKNNVSLLISGIINILLLLALAIFLVISPQLIGNDPAVIDLPELIGKSGFPLRGGIIWAITAIAIALLLRRKQQWRWLICANLIGFVAFFSFCLIPTFFLLDEARQLPLRELSEKAIQVQHAREPLFMVGFKKPSVTFYTQYPVQFFNTSSKAVNYFINPANQNPNSSTVLILSRPKDFAEKYLNPQNYQLIEQKGRYHLIRVDQQKVLKKLKVKD